MEKKRAPTRQTNRKLSAYAVRVIRENPEGKFKYQLAREFNVHPCAVQRILNGTHYKDVI